MQAKNLRRRVRVHERVSHCHQLRLLSLEVLRSRPPSSKSRKRRGKVNSNKSSKAILQQQAASSTHPIERKSDGLSSRKSCKGRISDFFGRPGSLEVSDEGIETEFPEVCKICRQALLGRDRTDTVEKLKETIPGVFINKASDAGSVRECPVGLDQEPSERWCNEGREFRKGLQAVQFHVPNRDLSSEASKKRTISNTQFWIKTTAQELAYPARMSMFPDAKSRSSNGAPRQSEYEVCGSWLPIRTGERVAASFAGG